MFEPDAIPSRRGRSSCTGLGGVTRTIRLDIRPHEIGPTD
jgi:hypothetical protein